MCLELRLEKGGGMAELRRLDFLLTFWLSVLSRETLNVEIFKVPNGCLSAAFREKLGKSFCISWLCFVVVLNQV